MEQIITRQAIVEAAHAIRERATVGEGAIGIVLGSGFGDLVAVIEDAVAIDYVDVPHMVPSTAPLHAGRFIIGTVCGRQVVCMQGRLHGYEGNSSQQIAMPIFIMCALGVEQLIVTNAAGGINPEFSVGDLMLIEDHINFLGQNPCAGIPETEVFPRYFDMTQAYAPELRERARVAASTCGVELKQGVYIATLGPSFETPAEIRAFRTMGADAVGMSTVYEVIAARSCGMEVLGISMISNPAAGVLGEPLSIDDVSIAARAAAEKVEQLIVEFLKG